MENKEINDQTKDVTNTSVLVEQHSCSYLVKETVTSGTIKRRDLLMRTPPRQRTYSLPEPTGKRMRQEDTGDIGKRFKEVPNNPDTFMEQIRQLEKVVQEMLWAQSSVSALERFSERKKNVVKSLTRNRIIDLSSFLVPILEANNFNNWWFRIQTILRRELCEDILETELSITTEAEKKDWHRKDTKAQSIIVQGLSDKHLDIVKDCKIAKQQVEALNAVFARSSSFTKLSAWRRLINLKSEPGNVLKILEAGVKEDKDIDVREVEVTVIIISSRQITLKTTENQPEQVICEFPEEDKESAHENEGEMRTSDSSSSSDENEESLTYNEQESTVTRSGRTENTPKSARL
ncbi:hypothetical protein JTB14_021693 [Gonioctena quinquepunctata]|nr:hypothetical protein JTB14_021693 [Gonioctena quinquepunctata]